MLISEYKADESKTIKHKSYSYATVVTSVNDLLIILNKGDK